MTPATKPASLADAINHALNRFFTDYRVRRFEPGDAADAMQLVRELRAALLRAEAADALAACLESILDDGKLRDQAWRKGTAALRRYRGEA